MRLPPDLTVSVSTLTCSSFSHHSSSELVCFLCFSQIDSQTHLITTSCCQSKSCLKCIAIWYLHYGKHCPYCGLAKKTISDEFDLIFQRLSLDPVLFEQVSTAQPSRSVCTQPLLPQSYFRPITSQTPLLEANSSQTGLTERVESNYLTINLDNLVGQVIVNTGNPVNQLAAARSATAAEAEATTATSGCLIRRLLVLTLVLIVIAGLLAISLASAFAF